MLLILINWILVSYISFNIGYAVRKRLNTTESGVAITVWWGFFIISLITTLVLFFIPVGWPVLSVFLGMAMILHVGHRKELNLMFRRLSGLVGDRWQLIFGGVLLFSLLVLSAQSSKINDDGYYYIQTMMWYSEVGFVRGISNLLMPMGFASSWHILQALFSFDFVDGLRLNDLNGLLTFTVFIYYLENKPDDKSEGLLAILVSLLLLLGLPFASAPSPDFPVIVFTVIAFYQVFYCNEKTGWPDILILAAFAATIKLSSVALVLLGIIGLYFVVTRRIAIRKSVYVLIISGGLLLVTKNIYQTGYPLYPYTVLGLTDLEWTTPETLLTYLTAEIKLWALEGKIHRDFLTGAESRGLIDTLQLVWSQEGLRGMINKIILVMFPVVLFTIAMDLRRRLKSKDGSSWRGFVHGIFVINFFVWLVFAPQYRFILPVYVFYVAWICWWWGWRIFSHRLSYLLNPLPLVTIAILLVVSSVPLSMDVSSSSTHIGKTDGYANERLLKPHVSFSFSGIDTLVVGKETYHHVKGNGYCWDSPLPCMSRAYADFLHDAGYRLKRTDSKHFVLNRTD